MRPESAVGRAGPEERGLITSDIPDLQSTSERTIVDLRGTGPLVSAGHYRYLAAQDPLPPQTHSNLFVIAFAVRSNFEFVVNGEVVEIEPGEALLIPPGNTYRTGVDAQSRGELVWLVVRAHWDESRSDSSSLWGVVEELLTQGVSTWRAPKVTIELLNRVLMDGDPNWSTTPFWQESLCTTALVEFSRALWEAAPQLSLVHPGLRQATTWAEENIDGPITAADLVQASGMSSSRFYQLFAESFGTSPKDYILRLKIDRAAELLRSTAATVTDVSHTLGFSSSQHFGTAFRRYFGMSPSAYRLSSRRGDQSNA